MTAAPFAALSDAGRVRAGNEDRWIADAERQIYAVSDGMGGQLARWRLELSWRFFPVD